jgi:hypothetical protein
MLGLNSSRGLHEITSIDPSEPDGYLVLILDEARRLLDFARVASSPPIVCFTAAHRSMVSAALLVGPTVLRRRPPWCEVLLVVIDPVRRARQDFGQPSVTRFLEIGAGLGLPG